MEYALAAIIALYAASVLGAYLVGRNHGRDKVFKDIHKLTEKARERYDEAKEEFAAGGGLAGAALDGVQDTDGNSS